MDPKRVVENMTAAIKSRKECLHLAVDRGLGEGMQIEKWILTEMLAKLIQLREDGSIDSAEGEHKYPIIKSSRYEHCDLWWRVNSQEHWLEVKTVVQVDQQRWRRQIRDDLEKWNRLRATDAFHHLTMVLPIESSSKEHWGKQLSSLYQSRGFSCEANWSYKLWDNQVLLMFLSAKTK
jgi:hypothetical protein